MNIRRFVATDMRKVLREVRAALGPDAVILSTNNVDDWVEVIAAIDYDDTLIGHWGDGGGAPERGADRLGTGRVEADAHGSADAQPRSSQWASRAGQAQEEPRSPAATYASIASADDSRDSEPQERVELSAPTRPTARPSDTAGQAAVAAVVGGASAGRDAASTGATGMSPQVAAELSDLRELLEHQLSSLAWNDANRRHPVYARTLRQYAKLGLDPAIANRLAARVPKRASSGSAWRMPLQALAERLPLAKHDIADLHGAYAVIGPTGVGKTTTIAKMAARFALRHGVQGLGLVTTDGYRIGARDQLMTFARILGTPMHVANDAKEMRSVLAGLGHKRLVLIDTAGMSQRDTRLAEQFAALRSSGSGIRTVLALSAAADLGCLRDAYRAFSAAAPVGLIATKIDEAVSLGPMLSLVLESRLPLAYLCDGQRVPEDLHLAGKKRAWLIGNAMQLARQYPRVGGESDLAAAFGGMGMVANG